MKAKIRLITRLFHISTATLAMTAASAAYSGIDEPEPIGTTALIAENGEVIVVEDQPPQAMSPDEEAILHYMRTGESIGPSAMVYDPPEDSYHGDPQPGRSPAVLPGIVTAEDLEL